MCAALVDFTVIVFQNIELGSLCLITHVCIMKLGSELPTEYACGSKFNSHDAPNLRTGGVEVIHVLDVIQPKADDVDSIQRVNWQYTKE